MYKYIYIWYLKKVMKNNSNSNNKTAIIKKKGVSVFHFIILFIYDRYINGITALYCYFHVLNTTNYFFKTPSFLYYIKK